MIVVVNINKYGRVTEEIYVNAIKVKPLTLASGLEITYEDGTLENIYLDFVEGDSWEISND